MNIFIKHHKLIGAFSTVTAYATYKNTNLNDSPIYTYQDVKKHNNINKGIWVSYKNKVYDITDFVENHPGGTEKIMLAAGKNLEPFWNIYQQHLNSNVTDILKEYYIGDLDSSSKPIILEDTFKDEPQRHPALIVQQQKPFNAEVPLSLLYDNWITPSELHYVRNHMPVPPNYDEFTFNDTIIKIDSLKKQFKETSIYATLQCGGNRRKEFDTIETTQGIKWGAGVISNTKWTGILLKDFLLSHGITLQKYKGKYICFEGADKPFDASLPIEYALDESKQVLLAYSANDKDILPDHGRPLRLIVPGIIGARSVKWLNNIYISDEVAKSTWQRGPAYRVYPPYIKNAKDAKKLKHIPPVYEMPVQSIICGHKNKHIHGIAWSGGGKRIKNVEVSIDNGKTWHNANLNQGNNQQSGFAWAWTFWDITLKQNFNHIQCRATDEDGNIQPPSLKDIWNFRGILNNSQHSTNLKNIYYD